MNGSKQVRSTITSAVRILQENLIYSFIVFSVFVVFYATGHLFSPTIPTETLRTLLSVMIGAQASVLAIVISVTLISTQLVANRYAPRMATLPFRTLLFKFTFFLFAVSIVLDVFLLVSVAGTVIPSPVYNGLLFVAIGIFFTVFLYLYFFIRGMIARTSPETLVTLFTNTLSADEYLAKSNAHAENPAEHAHPLQPLYRFVMAALSQNELTTAQSALDQYQAYTSTIIDELDDQDSFETESLACRRALFKTVLTDQLHSITIQGAQKDEFQIISTAVETQIKLGKQGLEVKSENDIPDDAIRGVRKTIIESPVTEDDHSTLNQAWPAVGELMKAETDQDRYEVLRKGSRLIENKFWLSLDRATEPLWHTDAVLDLFDDLCDAHMNTLQKVETELGFDNIDPRPTKNLDKDPKATLHKQVRYSREAIIKISSILLQFRIDEGEWLIPDGSFRSGWERLCVKMAATGATEYAVYLCEVLIEIAFLEHKNGSYDQATSTTVRSSTDPGRLVWAEHLATIHNETEEPIVEEAFKKMLAYDRQEGPPPLPTLGDDDYVESKYYYSKLSAGEYRALNVDAEYSELLERLRTQSIQQ